MPAPASPPRAPNPESTGRSADPPADPEAYARLLGELFGRAATGIKLGLDTIDALLAALGRPERQFACVVVGGTNGKGSTASLIARTLAFAGFRVGLYTSPHLLRFSERVRILDAHRDEEIRSAEVAEAVAALTALEAGLPRRATFFELATALALRHFAAQRVDVAVLEVGLGGRLDATNVVPKRLTVLTPIDLDHTQYLGTTVAAIASEKADLLPADGDAVIAPQNPEARGVIEAVAAARRTRLEWAEPGRLEAEGNLVVPFIGESAGLRLDRFPAGAYQRLNLGVAARACAVLGRKGLPSSAADFRAAAAALVWPGRYHWLSGSDGAIDVLVDGAHNPAGLAALRASLGEDPRAQRPCHIVFTVLSDRDPGANVANLPPRASLTFCPVGSKRGRAMADLADLAAQCDGVAEARLEEALGRARTAAARDGGFVLVTGSLFLAADALAYLTGAPRDPPIDG